MLANIKNDLKYLLNILEYIGKIQKYTENVNSPEKFYEGHLWKLKFLR
jgi:uncharacterized protein with HEPN domain